MYREGLSTREVGTDAFTSAVIDRLGDTPAQLPPAKYSSSRIHVTLPKRPKSTKELQGVDVFIDWAEHERDPDTMGKGLTEAARQVGWTLKMITNRGVKVFPDGLPETFWTDHWRCRFLPDTDGPISFRRVLELLQMLYSAGWDVIKTEHLYTFDGERAFSLGQGE